MFILLPLLVLAMIGYAVFGHRLANKDTPLARLVGDALPTLVTFMAALLMGYLFAEIIDARARPYHHVRSLWSAALPALVVAMVPRRLETVVSALIISVLSLLLVADLIYYRFFGGLVPLLAAGSAGMLSDVTDSVAEVMRESDAIYIAPVIGAWALAIRCPRPSTRFLIPKIPARFGIKTVLVVSGIACALALASDTGRWMNRSKSWRVLSALHMIGWGGILNAHVRDIARVSRERATEGLTDAEIDEVVNFFQEKSDARTELPGFGAMQKSNVLFIQIEGFQQFAVDIQVENEVVMPYFKSLIDRGLYYENVYDLTGESLTSDCGYMVLNSLHALKQGAVAFRRPENKFKTVAHVLKDAGYQTISAHGYRKGMWNRALLHPRYGIDDSYFSEELGNDPRVGWGLSDEGFFKKMVPILKESKRPFFAFLISLTSHHPFRYIPVEMRELKLSNRTAFSGYMHSMRYVDKALKTFFDELDGAGILDDTMVIIYGDHDSRMELQDEMLSTAMRYTNLTEQTVDYVKNRGWPTDKIPFLIIPPKKSSIAPRVVTTVGGQVDIAPTVLHHLGLEAPASFVGSPLVEGTPGHAFRVDGAATEGAYMLGGRDERALCQKTPLGPTVSPAACTDLRVKAERETTLSERATLYDLAKVINERVVVRPLNARPLEPSGAVAPEGADAGTIDVDVDGDAGAKSTPRP